MEDMDLSCPWCGTDMHCTLVEYDDYMADHVLHECAPWQVEQGYIRAGEPAITIND